MGFQNRMETHERYQKEIIDCFRKKGVLFSRFGVERGLAENENFYEALKKSSYEGDPVANLVRYLPDKAVVVDGKTFFCDIKTVRRDDTPNFSFELESLEVVKKLWEVGTKTFWFPKKEDDLGERYRTRSGIR